MPGTKFRPIFRTRLVRRRINAHTRSAPTRCDAANHAEAARRPQPRRGRAAAPDSPRRRSDRALTPAAHDSAGEECWFRARKSTIASREIPSSAGPARHRNHPGPPRPGPQGKLPSAISAFLATDRGSRRRGNGDATSNLSISPLPRRTTSTSPNGHSHVLRNTCIFVAHITHSMAHLHELS